MRVGLALQASLGDSLVASWFSWTCRYIALVVSGASASQPLLQVLGILQNGIEMVQCHLLNNLKTIIRAVTWLFNAHFPFRVSLFRLTTIPFFNSRLKGLFGFISGCDCFGLKLADV
jgi:hypothetical protein